MGKFLGKWLTVADMLRYEDPKVLNQMFPHGKPMTRRDLLKAGAIGWAASMTPLSLVDSLMKPNVAEAAVCANTPAFITLRGAGGMTMNGNQISLTATRDYAADYTRGGTGTKAESIARTVKPFGNSAWFDASGVLAGIRLTASAATLLNTTFMSVEVALQDDTASNKTDITYFINKAKGMGTLLPNFGMNNATPTGVGHQPAFDKMPSTPLAVGSPVDIANALTVTGSLSVLSDAQKTKVFSLINKLSESQARTLASQNGGAVLAALVSEATGTNASVVGGGGGSIDPFTNPTVGAQFRNLWNATGNNTNGSVNLAGQQTFGTIAYNVLNDQSGAGSVQIGGCDYHGAPTRAATDAKDTDVGKTIGQLLESAAIMKRKLFLYWTTDGSVAGPAGLPAGSDFTNDAGNFSKLGVFAYDPNGRTPTVDSSGRVDSQVGNINDQGAADQNTDVGNDASVAAISVFANYLSFAGNLGAFPTIVGNAFNTDQIDKWIRLRRIA